MSAKDTPQLHALSLYEHDRSSNRTDITVHRKCLLRYVSLYSAGVRCSLCITCSARPYSTCHAAIYVSLYRTTCLIAMTVTVCTAQNSATPETPVKLASPLLPPTHGPQTEPPATISRRVAHSSSMALRSLSVSGALAASRYD
jgi:hypothetical protein